METAFLAIAGPTATGKTALAIEAARALDGEIVSMDSRQIYRGLDIGTAKATRAERDAVPHHGLDLVDPGERYGAGRFARDARRWIAAIRARGRVPVLAGGTGFFLRALTHPIFREPPMDSARRRAVEAAMARLDADALARWTRRLDPDRAEVAVAGGRQRMTRAVVVALLTGRPLSWWHREAPAEAPPMAGVTCLLEVPPAVLDERIRARTGAMIEGGLVEEVAGLLRAGFGREDAGMDGVGYREAADHLAGECTLAEAAERIRIATRQYARRQRTWFRRQLAGDPVRVDGTAPLDVQCAAVVRAWREGSRAGERDRAEARNRAEAERPGADGGARGRLAGAGAS